MLAPTIGDGVVELDRLRQILEQALAHRGRDLGALDVLEEDRELVAAEPPGSVARPDERRGCGRRSICSARSPLACPKRSLRCLKWSRSMNRTRPGSGFGRAIRSRAWSTRSWSRDAVREPGQAVAVGVLAELVVQPGVVEGGRRLADEQLRELDVASREPRRRGRAQLHDPDRLAAHDERQHHERAVARSNAGTRPPRDRRPDPRRRHAWLVRRRGRGGSPGTAPGHRRARRRDALERGAAEGDDAIARHGPTC